MSYILEALRKADAERERGAVPDLHAQLLPGAATDDEPETRRSPTRRWPALLAVVAGAFALAWWWLGDSTPPAVAVQPASRQQTSPSPAESRVLPVPPAIASEPAAMVPDAPVAAASAVVPPLARAAPLAPVQPAPPRVQLLTAARAAIAASSPPTALVAKAAGPAPVPVPAPAVRVPPLSELPEELRRQVPPLAVGGSVYSPQAERRMVVINGQVFQEGANLAPGLQLLQIRPKSAVFTIGGQSFELPL